MARRRWFAPRLAVLPPRDAYARWAPSYPAVPHNGLMAAEQRAMLAAMPDVAGRIVLDAGCGTGRYLAVLSERGARRLLGVDFSPEMLDRVGTRGVLGVQGDLQSLPVATASVDVVVSGLAFNDVPALAEAIAECARVLRPGGTLLYSVVHPRGGALGWTREFPVPGGTAAVRGCWHSVADHERACLTARLLVDLLHHVSAVDAPDGGPVALVVRARKAA